MHRIAFCCLCLITLVSSPIQAGELNYSIASGYFEEKPDGKPLGPCHGGVVIDQAGNIYVTTDTPRGIVVFSPDGKFLRAVGPAGIHGLELRKEGGTEYIYGARPNSHEVVKLRLDGEREWAIGFPKDDPAYAGKGENAFKPCALTVAPDDSIFIADGYGSNLILKYDKSRKFVKSFGGPGAEPGKFNTCHGIALDTRSGEPMLLVCNRNNNRVEHWDLNGNFLKIIQKDLRMPAAVHIRGDYAVFPELQGRVTVIDRAGKIVAQVGDNPTAGHRANFGLPPDQWKEGICNSPHGASIDKNNNLIVSEWSQFGRVEKFVLQK